LPQCLDERPVGQGDVLVAEPEEHGGAVGVRHPCHLGGQARLTDSRLPGEQHQLTLAFLRAAPCFRQHLLLGAATEESQRWSRGEPRRQWHPSGEIGGLARCLAGGDANADPYRLRAGTPPRAVGGLLEGHATGDRVGGASEGHHQPVARALDLSSVMRRDDGAASREVFLAQHLVRVVTELACECSRADKITEHYRDCLCTRHQTPKSMEGPL
jgi:hypothetical protein